MSRNSKRYDLQNYRFKVTIWKKITKSLKEYFAILSESYEERYDRKHDFDLEYRKKLHRKM